MAVLNFTDKRLNDEAGQEIVDRYEQGRRVSLPKRDQFFESSSGGDARLIPSRDEWVLKIDDTALLVKPANNPVRGWILWFSSILIRGNLFSMDNSLLI